MALGQDQQLEKVMDEVLKTGDVKALDAFLRCDTDKVIPIKCSQHFLTKLDELVSGSLDQKESRSACLGLTIIYKFGKTLKLPSGCHGLSRMIAQGLPKKMMQWFEKCRQLWIQCGPLWDETLFNLSEDFFEALMIVHDSCKEGTYAITESFLYPVGQLAVEHRIYVLIQKEAIRKFNLILDKIPAELKKKRKILASQEASDIMIKLAGEILEAGDYDFQTALMEALCRMASPDQRKELADRWFSMEHMATAFTKIKDSEFETDCRKFLNLVNGMQGDRRRVYSYPCLEVYLDKYELLMPTDEKLEEFWIDFNLGSNSISFYFSLADEEVQDANWETICISENEVQSYTVTDEGKRRILQLKLSEVVVVGAVEGSILTIHFSSSLDILQAARSVYGRSKNKGIVGKTRTSVVKTTVKVSMEESNSQVVPESQVSLSESEKNTAPYLLPASSAPSQMVTPGRMKMSESTAYIRYSAEGSDNRANFRPAVMHSDASTKSKEIPSLERVHSCDRKGELCLGELRTTAKTCSHDTMPNCTRADERTKQSDSSLQSTALKQTSKKKNIPLAKAVAMDHAGQGEEHSQENGFVPDTQPRSERSISCNWKKLSVSELLMMPTQKISSLTKPGLSEQQDSWSSEQRLSAPDPISHKQLHTELTQRLQQVLNERSQSPAPQESAELQGKTCNMRGNSKGKIPADYFTSTLCAPKEQQAQRNDVTKEKNKGQMSLEAGAPLIKAPPKTSATKALQERAPDIKPETNRALSSREKRDAEVAGSMVKLISSRYESKAKDSAENTPQSWNPSAIKGPVFNNSWLSTNKREVSRAVSLKKSYSKIATSSTKQRNDVFSFSNDEPGSTGGKNKTFINSSATWSSGIHDSSVFLNTTKKGQPVPKEKRHVKKYLFSDTDTDYAVTEVSWLRESSRKPKPKVTKYSRQAPVKPKAVSPHTSYEFPDLPPPTEKPVKGETNPTKKKPDVKERPKRTVKPAAAPNRLPAARRRPQRAAAISNKSYKDPDTDDSQSELEEPPVSKENAEKIQEAARMTKKKTASKQPARSHKKLESNLHDNQSKLVSEQLPASKRKNRTMCSEIPEVKKRKDTSEQSAYTNRRPDSKSDLKKPSSLKQQRPENVVPDTSKLNKRNVSPVKEQTNALKDSRASRQTSLCSHPSSMERMRSVERSAQTVDLTCSPLLSPQGSPLPASPSPPCQDTPSSVLLIPKPHSTVSSKENFKPSSYYSAEKKCRSSKSVLSIPSLTPIGQTPTGLDAAEMNSIQQPSPPQSPLSLSTQPLLTSTLIERNKQSMPSPPQSQFPVDMVNNCPSYVYSKVSSSSLSMSSTKSSVLSTRVKDSSTAVVAVKTEKSPSLERDQESAQRHVSGPSRKRHISVSANFEEDEKEEIKICKMRGRNSPRLKPRKLFNSFAEVSAESEMSQVMSSSHTVSSCHWEAKVGDGDMDMDEDLESSKTALNSSHLCQHFSSELKKKFKSHHQMMEVYNRQSLKTVQQHVSSLNMQVTKHRTRRLEQFQEVLLTEISKLEQDDAALKSMEEDLDMNWKKQSMAFHSYQEQRNQRNEILTKAFQSNVCHSLEYEERVFSSQMCLISNDMKSIQDRLLAQMQEGELQRVKSSLHALFFP